MRIRKYAFAAALAAAASLAAACSGGTAEPAGGSSASGATTSAAAPGQGGATETKPAAVALRMSDSRLGSILTDQAGRTLYGFVPDKKGNSTCGENCVATWPPLTSRSPVTAGSGTSAGLLGTTTRTEGAVQATYGDWPLYYYAGDVRPGDVDGQGVNGIWFVIAADGKLIRDAG
jgi:predicted lipoprotein with Yx(FWY)xxD motif